jgi:Zn-dependent protease with chaperone function
VLAATPALAPGRVLSPGAYPAFAAIGLVANIYVSVVVVKARRRQERRADLEALSITQDAESFRSMIRTLAVANLSQLDPGPVPGHAHLAPPARIAIADRWAAAHRRPQSAPQQ